MAELTNEQIDQIFEACRNNVASLAGSITAGLGTECELTPGEDTQGAFEILNRVPEGPGIAVTLQGDGYGILCLIPESLPIPEWHHSPDEAQAALLETLAASWKENLLPDSEAEVQTRPVSCRNLHTHLESCQPTEDVRLLELSVNAAEGSDSPALIQIVLPVANPIMERRAEELSPDGESATDNEPAATNATSTDQNTPAPAETADAKPPDPALEMRMRRINKVPVDLIVRVADRKMEVQQLRSIAPGTLLMFDKPCDSLLDVYIGNKLYCRGEAVKVGENFGIKINECNSKVVRVKKVRQV